LNPDRFQPEWQHVSELIAARGQAMPDRLAVEVCGRAMTYGEVDAAASRVAWNLARLGVGKGDRVANLAFNCLEQLLVWFGANRLGAVWVPLNATLEGRDLVYALSDAAPKVLFVDTECRERLDTIWAELTPPPQRVLIGGEGEHSFDRFLSSDGAPQAVEILGADPAVIIYTGGTTGAPKGVVLPHMAWIASGYRYIDTFAVGPDDRHLCVTSLFHNAGLMIGTIGPIVAGIPTFVERWFSASNFWRRACETGATVIDPIGTMVTLLCHQPPGPLDRAHRVRVSLGVLSQVPPTIADTFRTRFGLKVVNVYSLSETGGVLIVHNKADSPKPDANGKPWGWCEIRIVDEADRTLPPGQPGEIAMRPTVPFTFMLGYLNNPEATVRCFRNLWLHTGDIGYLDEDGYLFFTGRQAHWLRTRGENVSAYEVETIISAYPGVREAIIVGVPAALGEEDVKLFVIPHEGAQVDPAALYQWCQGRMAPFKFPRFVELADDFPRSSTKREVERHKLKAQPNDQAWDAEAVFGRLSLRSGTRTASSRA